MTGFPRVLAAALGVTIALAGCHALPGGMAFNLKSGQVSLKRTFPAPLPPTLVAALGTLDDLGVRPTAVSLLSAPEKASTEMIGVVVTPLPKTNAELLNGKPFKEILFDRKLPETGGESPPFNPVQMSYQGEAKDGRPVDVFVWAEPDDSSKGTEAVMRTRIGLKRDDAWGKTFLAKVAARLDALQVEQPATVELPPSR